MMVSALANISAASAPVTATHTRGRRKGMKRDEVVGFEPMSRRNGARILQAHQKRCNDRIGRDVRRSERGTTGACDIRRTHFGRYAGQGSLVATCCFLLASKIPS